MEIKAISYRFTINMLIKVHGSNGCSKKGYMASTFTYWTRHTRLKWTVY